MSLIVSEVNLEIARLLQFDVVGMVRLGIPLDEATAIEAELVGRSLASQVCRQPVGNRRNPGPPPVADLGTTTKPKKRVRVEGISSVPVVGKIPEPFEAFDGGIVVNLPSSIMAGLPFAEEVDLDDFASLCLPFNQLRPLPFRKRNAA
jgi:hypothetical protein